MDCQTATGTQYEPDQKQKRIRIDYQMDTIIEYRMFREELVYHMDTLNKVDEDGHNPDAEYLCLSIHRLIRSHPSITFSSTSFSIPTLPTLQSATPKHDFSSYVPSPLRTIQSTNTSILRSIAGDPGTVSPRCPGQVVSFYISHSSSLSNDSLS